MKSNVLRIITLFVVFVLSSIIAFLSVAVAFISFFGIDNYHGDIRKVYVKGLKELTSVEGVEATLTPDTTAKITDEDIDDAKTIIEARLVNNNITDYEVKVDANRNVIVRFPTANNSDTYNTIKSLGETAMITFCAGQDNTNVILKGPEDIKQAYVGVHPENTAVPVVALELTDVGTAKFAQATQAYLGQTISIWMDDVMLSASTVNTVITNGQAFIDGMASADEATDLANKINAGSLPFELSVNENSIKTVLMSPSFRSYAPNAIAFIASIVIATICFIVAIVTIVMIIVNLIPRKKLTQVQS